jgi:hypothetical protein
MVHYEGDSFIVTKAFHGRADIERVPEDIVGRVGTLIERDGAYITLAYPNGVKLSDGSVVPSVEIVENDDRHHMEKVTFVTKGHEPGPYPGSVLLDVEKTDAGFWGRFAPNDPRRRHGGHLEDVKESIEREGLRHPIVMNRKLELRAGAYRLAAYKALGRGKIPAYITNTDAKRSYRL